MLTALVLLTSQAHAVNYTVKFCANYSVDYDDADPAVGDDYFTSNSDRPARGARVRVMENGTLIDKYYTYTDGDYLGDWCTGTLTNRGTEWDWLRFLWDLDTDAGVSTTTIFDIYDSANPNSWNATGDGTGSAYPATRLRDAANTAGVLTEWDAWDSYNGVER